VQLGTSRIEDPFPRCWDDGSMDDSTPCPTISHETTCDAFAEILMQCIKDVPQVKFSSREFLC
jgi:hypothetical protein